MEDKDRGERLKTSILIRMIMATGTAILIKAATGYFLCVLQDPINLDTCVRITGSLWQILLDARLFPMVSGSFGGVFFYYITGKWKTN